MAQAKMVSRRDSVAVECVEKAVRACGDAKTYLMVGKRQRVDTEYALYDQAVYELIDNALDQLERSKSLGAGADLLARGWSAVAEVQAAFK